MHVVPFCSSNVKLKRSEELNKIFKNRMENVRRFWALGVMLGSPDRCKCHLITTWVVIRWLFWWPGASLELQVDITDMLCCSHVEPFFSGRTVDQTWESSRNQTYYVTGILLESASLVIFLVLRLCHVNQFTFCMVTSLWILTWIIDHKFTCFLLTTLSKTWQEHVL